MGCSAPSHVVTTNLRINDAKIICCTVKTNGGHLQSCSCILVVTMANTPTTYHAVSATTTANLSHHFSTPVFKCRIRRPRNDVDQLSLVVLFALDIPLGIVAPDVPNAVVDEISGSKVASAIASLLESVPLPLCIAIDGVNPGYGGVALSWRAINTCGWWDCDSKDSTA
jgi:hypothetical protein